MCSVSPMTKRFQVLGNLCKEYQIVRESVEKNRSNFGTGSFKFMLRLVLRAALMRCSTCKIVEPWSMDNRSSIQSTSDHVQSRYLQVPVYAQQLQIAFVYKDRFTQNNLHH